MSTEQRFREAFQRLKELKPIIISRDSLVSQNNIAREAGLDPSALKKSRFPLLVAEIKEWIRENSKPRTPSRQNLSQSKAKRRTNKQIISALKLQRDIAASALLSADLLILELYREITELKSQLPKTTVISISGGISSIRS
ncbi:hypothetical protein [Pseudomonas sp. R76]|uniref:hypothetical protein n=1 Tax=Pseudomonas sp. R76 TaxID=1573711 RepID=UPI00131FB8D7|nr:hypothetical protein [Pseudomonas sp. R76]QHD09771.1 hypothetical protein PspR76_30325 [Pseudomonas sp. R76]